MFTYLVTFILLFIISLDYIIDCNFSTHDCTVYSVLEI